MTDLLLQRLEQLFLLCCGLALATLIGWASFAYLAWSGRHLSDQVSTLAAERNELIAERNDALTKLDQLERSVGNLEQVETKLSAARAEQNRVVELTESKAGRVPWRGVAGVGHRDLRQGRVGQAARAGRLTMGSSLRGAMVSRVM